jgi:hypothetical protein
MFNWLKRLGGRSPRKNIAGIDIECLALLLEDSAGLEKLERD